MGRSGDKPWSLNARLLIDELVENCIWDLAPKFIMDRRENKKHKLRLIKSEPLAVGSVEICIAPEGRTSYSVDAVVAEEDTFLVLSAAPEFIEPNENPILVMMEAFETPPAEPGSVLVKDGYPLRLLGIIHDLNQEPSWKEEWIEKALDGIFREGESRKLQTIALPLLGTLHGKLDKKRFIALLLEVLKRKMPSYPKKLWLVAPEGTTAEIREMLETELRK